MTSLEYFTAWVRTRWSAKRPQDLAVMALGLGGEAGEVTELIKKQIRGDGPLNRDELMLEMGDVLHYWCRIAIEFGLDPTDIMTANRAKLEARDLRRKHL